MANKKDIIINESGHAVVTLPPKPKAPPRELHLRSVLTSTREPAEPLVEIGGYRLPPGATVLREAEPLEDGTQPPGTIPTRVFDDLLRYQGDRYAMAKWLEPKAVDTAIVEVSDGKED